MPRILLWEFGKLLRLRSAQIGLLTALLLPALWSLAPAIQRAYGLTLVSGWQVPALSLLSGMSFLFPFLTAMASAELLGSEMSLGTLRSWLLWPYPRSRLLLAKGFWILIYPALLLVVSLLSSLLIGSLHGLGGFYGGTGLGPNGFAGSGFLSPAHALLQVVRGTFLATLVLWPIGALALLFTVLFSSTAAGALSAITVLLLMRLLATFPSLKPLLLTTYLDLYLSPPGTGQGLVLLLIYTLGFLALSLLLFERKEG
jgi:ABC-2 type transport system permease protein